MMFKIIFIVPLILTQTVFADYSSNESKGVSVTMKDSKGKPYSIVVKRNIPKECKNVHINNKLLWSGNYAHKSVPDVCKSTYIHTKGKLLPMKIDAEVETYGELEILFTLKDIQKGKNIVLIDSRQKDWFKYRTIPGAINMPFNYLKEREEYEFEFEDALKFLGVKKDKDDHYDFDNAKTMVVFCNGPWCTQSPSMIFSLIEIGYPTEKLKWYRGGMQDWLGAGMTTTRP